MMTKIFHPNISKKGEICVDTLKKGWRKDYGVGHVLTVSWAKRRELTPGHQVSSHRAQS